MKIRVFPEHNYKAFHFDGKTIRIALDSSKPITELAYPEFYDVKVTSHCEGNCQYCYQESVPSNTHVLDIIERFHSFFDRFDNNQRPFQIAFGGGCPVSHPLFIDLMKECNKMDMVPNYTTNGMWTRRRTNLIDITKEYCGGVAVSTHPHLEKYWRAATEAYLEAGIHTNLHVIIGDRESIDRFADIYKSHTGRVKYFVLLPLSAQGRSTEEFSDWDYLCSKIDGSPADVAFGANFHPYLAKNPGRFKVSIYDPESMSAYLDLETMKVYKSSFSSEEKKIGHD
jgi:hypothetical protein